VSSVNEPTSVVALIWMSHEAEIYSSTVASLRAAHPDIEIVIGGAEGAAEGFECWNVVECPPRWLVHALEFVTLTGPRHVVVISEPVVVPPGFLERAVAAVEDDLRLATVSFLSNAAGALSVPSRNSPMMHQVGPHDEVSITRSLRTLEPSPSFAPIAGPVGPVTLLSRFALSAIGGFDRSVGSTSELLVADFGLRAGQRGFVNMVDGGTYYTRAYDLAPYQAGPLDAGGTREHALLSRRYPAALMGHELDSRRADSALGLTVSCAAAKIRGLRIIIDGRDIGPKEMGTQVQILSLVRELAIRSDVDSVQLALPGGVPAYAAPFLQSEKIAVIAAPDHDMSAAAPADIIHRPSQPSVALPLDLWREKATRVVVTLLDVIAYQVGAYFASGDEWLRYRQNLTAGAAGADAIVVTCDDARRHIEAEALPLESDRTFLVPLGTDHLSGAEPEEFPAELSARGFVHQEFLLVLGTNYGHKNRDLAIRTWQQLRAHYPQLSLVLAGAYVPNGSSRRAETVARQDGDTGLFVLPDVTSAERNWLMRHASAMLYPTSAEGFGLVPFEAARFGTPTVGVRFSPLRDLNPGAAAFAETWDPGDLARAVGQLLNDPKQAAEQVRITLNNANQLRWADTAAGLTNVYRNALSRPARWPYTR